MDFFLKFQLCSDILSTAVRLCVYPIDFSIYAACPRAHESNRELSVSEYLFSNNFVSNARVYAR